MLGAAKGTPQNVGSQRLLEAAARGKVLDKRLWTEVTAAIGRMPFSQQVHS
jgi:alkanesulfonate monooxygenase